MRKSYFITGTDTDAGKTLISAAFLYKAKQEGLTTVAMKPIAAGCEETEGGLRNDDALLLQKNLNLPEGKKLAYEQINPVALKQAIAPHIAAANEGRQIQVSFLEGIARGILQIKANVTVIEGAGGWRVPINPRESLARLPQLLQMPVILVVNMKLGCLNHALLTAEAIRRDGLTLAGWVANNSENKMPCYDENLATLKSLLSAPLLGEVPYIQGGDDEKVAEAASYLSWPESEA